MLETLHYGTVDANVQQLCCTLLSHPHKCNKTEIKQFFAVVWTVDALRVSGKYYRHTTFVECKVPMLLQMWLNGYSPVVS